MFEDPARIWDLWARYYDEDTKGQDPHAAASALADLAAGEALELGVGTGRIALEIARRGTPVTGLDASSEMLRLLDERRGRLPVEGVLGDMADFDLGGRRFSLVYVVASSFFLLATQAAQVSCLRSAASHLLPGAHLVIEAAVPHASRMADRGDQMIIREMSETHLKFSAFVHDPVTQTVRAQEVRIDADTGRARMLPNLMRYAYPPEIDLMAQLAGLDLVRRVADWQGSPLNARSTHHVSVYTRGPVPPTTEPEHA